jgi:molybdate transport system substrate-binding protein
MKTKIRRSTFLALVATVLALVPNAGSARAEAEGKKTQLVVFAAASLQDAFTELGSQFEGTHGVEITFNFAGSQELRTQLEHGAAADVFASADQKQMAELVTASRVKAPIVFARNEPVIVVSHTAQEKIRKLADLPSAERIVIGAPEVPIGRYTLEVLDRASTSGLGEDFRKRVEARVVSRELNVRQVLAKVALGEADVGIVYRTDTRTIRDGVSIVTVPLDVNVIAEYPIAVVEGARHPESAEAWRDFVLSPDGQRVLGRFGFIPPTGGKKSE